MKNSIVLQLHLKAVQSTVSNPKYMKQILYI